MPVLVSIQLLHANKQSQTLVVNISLKRTIKLEVRKSNVQLRVHTQNLCITVTIKLRQSIKSINRSFHVQ